MTFKIGESVVVTQDGVNRVGVILDKFVVSKRVVYDVMLENYTAVCMIGATSSASTYINQQLTGLLCVSGMIECKLPYKHLLENELLPITKS
jgi:hypothetical protein